MNYVPTNFLVSRWTQGLWALGASVSVFKASKDSTLHERDVSGVRGSPDTDESC